MSLARCNFSGEPRYISMGPRGASYRTAVTSNIRHCNWRLHKCLSGDAALASSNFQPGWLWLLLGRQPVVKLRTITAVLLKLPRTRRFCLHTHLSYSRLSLRLTTCTIQPCRNRVPFCLLRCICQVRFVWFAASSLGCEMADNQYRKQYEYASRKLGWE